MAIEALEVLKRFITRGNVSLDTVPPLEGALLPNNELEEARSHPAGTVPEPNDVHVDDRGIWVATLDEIRLAAPEGDTWETYARLPSRITAMTPSGDRWIVATLADGIVVVGPDRKVGETLPDPGHVAGSVTDLAVDGRGALYASVGSATSHAVDWHVDLMHKGSSGSIWRWDGDGAWQSVLEGLAWPAGLAVDGERLTFTEAWRHRVMRLGLTDGGTAQVVVRNLPGYPGRIRTANGSGTWLTMFAMRTQLVEFVLTQDDYLTDMMAEVDPRYWVRPDLRTLNTGLVPLQGGGIKKLGQTKPWAPPRSYGLVVHLDDAGEVTRSFHSRAGGAHHGVTGVAERDGDLVLASQGGDAVLILGKVSS